MTLCCYHHLLSKEWYSREQQGIDNFLFKTVSINTLLFSFTLARGDVLAVQERERDAVFNYVWNARK